MPSSSPKPNIAGLGPDLPWLSPCPPLNAPNRIELSIDPNTWDPPMDEDMVSIDPIEFHLEKEPYKDRINSYQRKTGLTKAVQTGIDQLNGILTLGGREEMGEAVDKKDVGV